jgi:hypothetical protein
MSKLFRTLLIASLCVAAGCAATEGNGVSLTETRQIVAPFDGLVVRGGLQVEVVLALDLANVGAVTVTSDSNIVPKIETVVVRGLLEVTTGNIAPTIPTLIEVQVADLASVSAADEGSVVVANIINRNGDGIPGTFAVALSEGALGEFSGTCTTLQVIVSGSSALAATDLICQRGTFDVLDGGLVVSHITESAFVRASGPSIIRLTGSPSVESYVSDEVTLVVE